MWNPYQQEEIVANGYASKLDAIYAAKRNAKRLQRKEEDRRVKDQDKIPITFEYDPVNDQLTGYRRDWHKGGPNEA